MSYYFYIIEGARGRPGFGITKNIKERAKQYSSHMGEIANFPRIFTGNERHIRALEKTFKRDPDLIWQVEDWNTEWIEGMDMDTFIQTVLEIIENRHWDIQIVSNNYNHTLNI